MRNIYIFNRHAEGCPSLGMLSKSKGQVLRVSAAFHFLFNINNSNDDMELSDEISEEAICASINFVALCCQQTAFMAGRGKISEEIQLIKDSKCMFTQLHVIFSMIDHNRF